MDYGSVLEGKLFTHCGRTRRIDFALGHYLVGCNIPSHVRSMLPARDKSGAFIDKKSECSIVGGV